MSQRRIITILFYLWLAALIAADIAGAAIAYPSKLWWMPLLIIPVPIYFLVKTIRMVGWMPR